MSLASCATALASPRGSAPMASMSSEIVPWSAVLRCPRNSLCTKSATARPLSASALTTVPAFCSRVLALVEPRLPECAMIQTASPSDSTMSHTARAVASSMASASRRTITGAPPNRSGEAALINSPNNPDEPPRSSETSAPVLRQAATAAAMVRSAKNSCPPNTTSTRGGWFAMALGCHRPAEHLRRLPWPADNDHVPHRVGSHHVGAGALPGRHRQRRRVPVVVVPPA